MKLESCYRTSMTCEEDMPPRSRFQLSHLETIYHGFRLSTRSSRRAQIYRTSTARNAEMDPSGIQISNQFLHFFKHRPPSTLQPQLSAPLPSFGNSDPEADLASNDASTCFTYSGGVGPAAPTRTSVLNTVSQLLSSPLVFPEFANHKQPNNASAATPLPTATPK